VGSSELNDRTQTQMPFRFLKTKFSLILISLTFFYLSGCAVNQTKKANSNPYMLSKVKNTPIQSEQTVSELTAKSIEEAIPVEEFHQNLWHEIRTEFHLANQHYGNYDDYLRFYGQRKTHLQKVSQRAKPYLYYIFNEVKQRGVPYEIALLPVVESGFRATAMSHQRAMGLWQFIPSTADIFELDRNWWYDGRKDVTKSTQAALDYLQKLYKLNNDDWLLALASYNAGLGNVYKAQKKYRKKHKHQPDIQDYQPDFWEIRQYLPKETQHYVPRLLAVSHMVEFAELFELSLEPIDNQVYFSTIKLNNQVALNQVAKITDTPLEQLAQLNPGFLQAATPPKGQYQLLIPVEKAPAFKQQLNNNHDLFKVNWQRHKIRRGDNLSQIAEHYKTSSNAIKKLNGIRSSRIVAGKTLLIPIPSDASTISKVTKDLASKPSHKASGLNASYHIHTVESGDSLWKLAKYYQISTKELTSWNDLSSKKPLRIGQKLKVYRDHYGIKIEHTLKAGESLWSLAKQYSVTTKQIANWNNISQKKILQPGMKLTLWTKNITASNQKAFYEYIVRNGDNLWNIAKANQVSAKDLAIHNNLNPKSLLKPGQILKIPAKS